jgi:hypothetical protein
MVVLAVPVGHCRADSPNTQSELSMLGDRYGSGQLASGDWVIQFGEAVPLPVDGTVTGLAFGPGRKELAYCSGDALWSVSIADVFRPQAEEPRVDHLQRRLIWRAPEGSRLSGPIWWAANGSSIALMVGAGGEQTLTCIGYALGDATALARHGRIVDAAWEPSAKHLAYVAEDKGSRAVFVQMVPPADERRIGEGGLNLRWSLEGKLSWQQASSPDSWTEWAWTPGWDDPKSAGAVPPRPAGAMWSPDGLLCAALEQAPGTNAKQLVICQTQSSVNNVVSLPDAQPDQLLGWSPDGKIILLLVRGDLMLAVSAYPPSDNLTRRWAMGRAGAPPYNEAEGRAAMPQLPLINPAAGLPSWSSDGELLAYVSADEEVTRHALEGVGLRATWPANQIIVQTVRRQYFKPPTPKEAEAEHVLSNMKNIALALRMYLTDNNDVFPPVENTEQLRSALDEYVPNQSVFMRPGSTDQVVVQYLVPPGVRLAEVRDQDKMPMAVVDYADGFYVIAYGDGHAVLLRKQPGYQESWEAWWREFEKKQGQQR